MPLVRAAAVLAGAAAATAISFTRPFTWQADLVTALGIAGVVLSGAVGMFRRHRGRLRPGLDSALDPPPPPVFRLSPRAAGAWIAAAFVVGSCELALFLSQPRRTHPTISYYLGLLSAHEVDKGLLFALWLAGGWWILENRLFSRVRAPGNGGSA